MSCILLFNVFNDRIAKLRFRNLLNLMVVNYQFRCYRRTAVFASRPFVAFPVCAYSSFSAVFVYYCLKRLIVKFLNNSLSLFKWLS